MYRQNYSEQGIPPNINPNMNPSLGQYDFRNPVIHYKPQNNIDNNLMQNLPPMQQTHHLYFQNQNVQQMEQYPYLNMVASQPPIDPNYDFSRYYWRQIQSKNIQNYPLPPQNTQYVQPLPPPPSPNIVQRISGLIKSQLPMLQAIMVKVSSNYVKNSQSRRQYSKSPSRSRSKQRHRKVSDSSHDWLCRKCSFSNYDWRQTCKKCYQVRSRRNNFSGPSDWKCTKCGNINNARLMECSRCNRYKNGKD